MKILFPRGVNCVQNVFNSPLLGEAGALYRFPADLAADGERYDFSGALDARRASTLKIYCADAVQEGFCGYRYPAQGVRRCLLTTRGSCHIWGSGRRAGGYRGDVNCARWNPQTGFYDSIELAQRTASARAQTGGNAGILPANQNLSESKRTES